MHSFLKSSQRALRTKSARAQPYLQPAKTGQSTHLHRTALNPLPFQHDPTYVNPCSGWRP